MSENLPGRTERESREYLKDRGHRLGNLGVERGEPFVCVSLDAGLTAGGDVPHRGGGGEDDVVTAVRQGVAVVGLDAAAYVLVCLRGGYAVAPVLEALACLPFGSPGECGLVHVRSQSLDTNPLCCLVTALGLAPG